LKKDKFLTNKHQFGILFCCLKLNPKPEFIDSRLKIWDELMIKYKEELAAKPSVEIKVKLPDGKIMNGESWRTTPLQIAEQIRFIFFKNTLSLP
jgi:threonyl-tRNA synthetase